MCTILYVNTVLFICVAQMGKQTMGTPAQALKHRGDNKLYRIQVRGIYYWVLHWWTCLQILTLFHTTSDYISRAMGSSHPL